MATMDAIMDCRSDRYQIRELGKLQRRLFPDGGTVHPSITSWVAALEMELMGPQIDSEFNEFGSLQGIPKLDAYMHQLETVKMPIMEAVSINDPLNISSLCSLSERLAKIEEIEFGQPHVVSSDPFYQRFARAWSLWGPT